MAHRTFARSVAVVAAAALTLVVSPGVSSAMMIRNAASGADVGEKPPASEAEEPRPKPPQKHKPAPLQGEKPTPPTPSPTPEKDKPEPGGDNDADNHDNDGDGDDGDEPATSTGERIVDLAARHAGAPYVYGADGPDQFDCSGLTQYVHARLGIDLPRTSRDQRAALPNCPRARCAPATCCSSPRTGTSTTSASTPGTVKCGPLPSPATSSASRTSGRSRSPWVAPGDIPPGTSRVLSALSGSVSPTIGE